MRKPSRFMLSLQAIVYIGAVSAYGLGHAASTSFVAAPLVTAVPTSTPQVTPATLVQQQEQQLLADPITVPTSLEQPQGIDPVPALQSLGPVLGNILMYHYVRTGIDFKVDPIGYGLSVSPEQLDADIAAMVKAGYTDIDMDQYAGGQGGPHAVAMTFDDGYEDFYTAAWPIFQKYRWHATLYIITGKVGTPNYLTWSQISQLQAAGFQIGAHTVDHQDLSTQTPAQQQVEIFGSKATLEAHLGITVNAFCYPSGKYNAETLELVRQAGFTSATTTQPGIARQDRYDPFLLPRIRVSPTLSVQGLLNELAK